ncbi:MAG: hypothetical protein VX641_01535 [Planctomycetota bacterium]|nr:hypothetical protein [Planctomycetota bacterium]
MRILLLSIVFGGGVVVYLWYGLIDRERALSAQIQQLEARMAAEIEAREQMIDRLQRTRRMARLEILDQPLDSDGEAIQTTARLIELDDRGAELARQEFTVPGAVLFVDAWTVRFEYERVAHADPFAGQTLVLLRRIYSDRIAPRDGQPIDTPGGIPAGYAVSEEARFERAVWRGFWTLASDADRARDLGIRVAQGEAVYKPVKAGEVYDLLIEASGGMTLQPLITTARRDEPGSQLADAFGVPEP